MADLHCLIVHKRRQLDAFYDDRLRQLMVITEDTVLDRNGRECEVIWYSPEGMSYLAAVRLFAREH